MNNKKGKLNQKTQFIDLRVQGYSYEHIAKRLQVAKGTLTNWDTELKDQIIKLKTSQLDELHQKYFMFKEARINLFGQTLLKIHDELETRDFSSIPTERLIDLQFKYLHALKGEFQETENDTKLNRVTVEFGF